MIMEAVSVVGISAGVAVAVSALVKRVFGGKKDPCPKCGKKGPLSYDSEGRKVVRCKPCGMTVVLHERSELDISLMNCPQCSGTIEFRHGTLSDSGVDEWVCKGFLCREDIVKVRGERMTPKNMITIPKCGWTGRASEYGKTWR